MREVAKKICLLGDPAVGKTSLIRRFVFDRYDDKYLSTLGTKVTKKIIDMNDTNLRMMIWDLAGQKEFRRIRNTVFRGVSGAIIVGDLTRKDTLEDMKEWIEELTSSRGAVPFILIGNKSDLEGKKPEKLRELSTKYNVPFLMTSAKTGENVEKAFLILGKMILESREMDMRAVKRQPEKERLTPREAEDEIIDKFCKMMGDIEFGMSIVRKQLKNMGIDFRNVSKEDMEKLVKNLLDVMKSFKGERELELAKKEFNSILKRCSDEQNR